MGHKRGINSPDMPVLKTRWASRYNIIPSFATFLDIFQFSISKEIVKWEAAKKLAKMGHPKKSQ